LGAERRLTFAPGKPCKGQVYYHEAKWPRPGKPGQIVLVTITRVSVGDAERFDVWFDKQHHTSPDRDTFEKALDQAEGLLDVMDPQHEGTGRVHVSDEGDYALDISRMEAIAADEG
jgi:hypothetical protein